MGVGYNIGVGNKNAKNLPVEVGIGKQITPNFYIGEATGARIGTAEGDQAGHPLHGRQQAVVPPLRLSMTVSLCRS